MPIVAKSVQYEYEPSEITTLIANALNVPAESIAVQFVIQEVGGDPMDRFPGRQQVTKVRVTVKG